MTRMLLVKRLGMACGQASSPVFVYRSVRQPMPCAVRLPATVKAGGYHPYYTVIRTILSSYHLLRYGAGRFVRSQLDIVSYTSCSWLWSVFTHISMFEIVNVSSNNPRLNSVSCLRLERHTCGATGNGGREVARNRSAARLATPTWQHCATAVWLKRELSVGTKWRPCVIDTVNFLSKMSVSVMCLVVGPPERCPVTGRALGKPGLYVRIPEIQT